MSSYSTFDPNHPRFRCCCGCCHATTGAIIVGMFQIAPFVAAVVRYALGSTDKIEIANSYNYEWIGTTGAAIMLGLTLIAVILMFIGIWRVHHMLLIPELIVFAIQVLFFLAVAILCIVLLIDPNLMPDVKDFVKGTVSRAEHRSNEVFGTKKDHYLCPDDSTRENCDRIIIGIALGVFLLVLSIWTWLFSIIRKCYDYLKARREYGLVSGPGAYYARA